MGVYQGHRAALSVVGPQVVVEVLARHGVLSILGLVQVPLRVNDVRVGELGHGEDIASIERTLRPLSSNGNGPRRVDIGQRRVASYLCHVVHHVPVE